MKFSTLFAAIVLLSIKYYSSNFGTSAVATVNESGQPDLRYMNANSFLTCDTSEDCTPTGSSCIDKKCQCQPDYVFNAALTDCLKAATAYGNECVETSQCTAYLLAGGNCINGSCSCTAGYHYLHGRCYKSSGLRDKCRSSEHCYVNGDYQALSCTENICRCSDGFYQREYRTCRREAKKIGAECLINLDCTFDENAKCEKKKGCFLESKIPENAFDEQSWYKVRPSLEVQVVHTDIQVRNKCNTYKECEVLSTAFRGTTSENICKPGYFPDEEKTHCIPEIGEKCKPSDAIPIKNSECRNGRWGCTIATIPLKNNRKCLKAVSVYNTSCVFDEQCYVFGPDAACPSKRCICNENSHYSAKHMFCWINKALGENCLEDEDCYVNKFNSKLRCSETTKKCACPTGSHVNSAATDCIADTASLGYPCTANEDCKPLDNSMCDNNTCSCLDNYFNLSGQCVSGINAQCKQDNDCKVQNSSCISDKCSCLKDYVPATSGLCVRVSSFGGACHYDVQCSLNATSAFCAYPELPALDEFTISSRNSVNGICSCVAGHHYRYEKCYKTKILGELCKSRGECYVESDPDSVFCLKGVCTCDWDFKKINGTFCETSGSTAHVSVTSIVLTLFTLLLITLL